MSSYRLSNFKWRQAVPRILVDFAIVHLSMIAALAISVLYQTAVGAGAAAYQLTRSFSQYYLAFFLVLSPLFPLVFLANGFYTRSRAYRGKYKLLVIVRGALAGVLLFFGLDFLLFGAEHQVGRSVAVPFSILAGLGVTLARVVKNIFETRYDVKPKPNGINTPPRMVLVVGGAGYIGSLLVRRLLEAGRSVRVLDSLVYGDAAIRDLRGDPNFELLTGDCRNIQDMVAAVEGAEAIVDLAAIVGDPACEQDRKTALEVNYAATRMMIEIAKGHRVRRLLFASSCSIYGATDVEVDEQSMTLPISFYGQTKLDSEAALLEARTPEFHPTVLRLATVFGYSHRPRFDLVVNLLAAKARQESLITIYNGRQWRPFIHVRDVVEAIVRVLDAPLVAVSGEVFNLGDDRLNHTLADVAETIRRVFPNTRIEQVENADRRNYRVNFSKIRNRLGFQCRWTLEDGIRELEARFNEGLIPDYRDLRYHNQRFLQAAGSPLNKSELDSHIMAAFANGASSSLAASAAAGRS